MCTKKAKRKQALIVSIMFFLVGCGGTTADQTQADKEMDAFVSALSNSSLSAEAFSEQLAEAADQESSESLVAFFPEELQTRIKGIRPALRIAGGGDRKPGISRSAAGVPRASRKAVVAIIANGHPVLWIRNIVEWIALNHFNNSLRAHYDVVRVCVGKKATWGCFRKAVEHVGTSADSIDLVIETHGDTNTDHGPYAIDNAGDSSFAGDILVSRWAGKYRMGYFMPCNAADGESGFPQIFRRGGGIAAYAARGLSTPISDLVIQAELASGETLQTAVERGNANPIDWFSRQWIRFFERNKDRDPVTPKRVFGQGSFRLE